jgi:hypothetical protein
MVPPSHFVSAPFGSSAALQGRSAVALLLEVNGLRDPSSVPFSFELIPSPVPGLPLTFQPSAFSFNVP